MRISEFNKLNNLNFDTLRTHQKNDVLLNLLTDEEANEILIALMDLSKNSLSVQTSQQVIELLEQSERVSVDIFQMLTINDLQDNLSSDQENQQLCNIIFRKWQENLLDLQEFRCFFYNYQLTAISQYNYYIYSQKLNEKETSQKIQTQIFEKFEELKQYLPMPNGVIDFAVQNEKVFMIELNPFNDYEDAGTGGALFSWQNDIEILKNGPLQIRVVQKPLEKIGTKFCMFGGENLILEAMKSILEQKKIQIPCNIF